MLGNHADPFFLGQANENVLAALPNSGSRSYNPPDQERVSSLVLAGDESGSALPGMSGGWMPGMNGDESGSALPGMSGSGAMLPSMGGIDFKNPAVLIGIAIVGYILLKKFAK